MSGPKDYISDGNVVIEVSNGHPLLASITGSGCLLGAVVASFCGAATMNWKSPNREPQPTTSLAPGNMLAAALGGYAR